MEQSEVKPWSLLRAPEGPLAPHIDAFARHLGEQGFRRRSTAPQIRLVAKFSHWLKANAVGLCKLSDEHVDRFLRRLKRRHSTRSGDHLCLLRLMTFLREAGLVDHQVSAPCVAASAIQIVVVAFGRHLREAQALSRATCIQYLAFAERFLTERFGVGAIELTKLCAADVVGFIKRRASQLSQARAKSATIALRSFLRYLRFRGDIVVGLRLHRAGAIERAPALLTAPIRVEDQPRCRMQFRAAARSFGAPTLTCPALAVWASINLDPALGTDRTGCLFKGPLHQLPG